eukprot:scaffold120452_cov18-Tisochrysis_lutea.AAC.1
MMCQIIDAERAEERANPHKLQSACMEIHPCFCPHRAPLVPARVRNRAARAHPLPCSTVPTTPARVAPAVAASAAAAAPATSPCASIGV